MALSAFVALPCAVSQMEMSAQTSPSIAAASASTPVPPLVAYVGVAFDAQGRPLTSSASISFLIFKDETGGDPLFAETQTVELDLTGHYKVQLGATLPNGLPQDLFATGEARWLEVQIAGQPAQSRILLASVPYALKAADAATLGGLPASAYALAGSWLSARGATTGNVTPDVASTVTTTGGAAGYVSEFTGATTIASSPIFVKGADVGIGTATPTAPLTVSGNSVLNGALTVNGDSTFNGPFVLPPPGTATKTTGYNSQFIKLETSAWNSSTSSAVNPRFQWVGEVHGNNSAAPTATLNLQTSTTTASPTETGFYFNANGTINFATGQTFPGNALTGVVNATSYNLGGSSFATGSTSGATAYLGFAGNPGSSGSYDIGVGYKALSSNTAGSDNAAVGNYALYDNITGNANTAIGNYALYYNTTGGGNTATGSNALVYNTTGLGNTALGYLAGPDSASPALTNSTALGANAIVSQSNSLVLGSTNPGSPGSNYVKVGIGTATPSTTMEISVNAPNALGPTLLLSNPGGTTASAGSGQAAMASIDFKTYLHASTQKSPTSRIVAVDDNYGNYLAFQAKIPGSDSSPLATAVEMQAGPNAYTTFETPIIVTFYNGVPPATPTIAELGGNVDVDGTISADSKEFKIDLPSDPANKYLAHTSVESSEMMNIYSGNVITDELGIATVTLPDWFEAENGDFRYQLTTIGRDAHAWVSQEVSNHQFKIATNATFVKVSWQITAVRQDAYAKAHPLVVVQAKSAQERGFYRHPELYGQTEERSLQWARHPQQMQRMKAQRAANAPSTSAEVSR